MLQNGLKYGTIVDVSNHKPKLLIYNTTKNQFCQESVIKIDMKNKILHLIAKIVCGLLAVVALFLLGISLIFAISGGAPNVFGYNIYLVETDAFQLLHKGTAVFVKQEHMAEIVPGNIVIFDDGVNGPQLGEVQTNELSDGVYSFIALNEANTAVYLTQSQIVGKAMSYSDFLGAIIGFAVSPFGVFCLAVIPCLIVIGLEVYKAFNKSLPMPAIEPVNKQHEVPTYVPRARSAYDEEPPSLDDSLEEGDSRRSYDVSHKTPSAGASISHSRVISANGVTGKIPQSHAATGVIPQPTRSHTSDASAPPLFLGPNRQPAKRTETARMPLSQKALNEAIAASRAEREAAVLQHERTEVIKDIQKGRTEVLERERIEDEERRRVIAEKTARAERAAVLPRNNAVNGGAGAMPRFTPPSRNTTQKAAVNLTRELPRAAETADDIVQQYVPARRPSANRATTSLPRLDALLNDESENEDKRYNIDDILASLDKNA